MSRARQPLDASTLDLVDALPREQRRDLLTYVSQREVSEDVE